MDLWLSVVVFGIALTLDAFPCESYSNRITGLPISAPGLITFPECSLPILVLGCLPYKPWPIF